MGRQEGRLTYFTNGDVLTGTATAMGQTLEVLNGRVEGDRFFHDLRIKILFRSYAGSVSGTVDGDTVSGVISSPMGNLPFTGSRVSLK
jgi:hypothetical protein